MKSIARLLIIITYIVILIIPGYTFFIVNNSNLNSLSGQDVNIETYFFILFRLFGLYALTFVWTQVMIGGFRIPLTKILGSNMLKIHISLGIFTLIFTLLHPLLFYTAMYISSGILPVLAIQSYVHSADLIYGFFGVLAFYMMIVTVVTAKLRTNRFINKYWKKIHLANYLIFLLSLTHAFKIGSDSSTAPLKYLYLFFFTTFICLLIYKFVYLKLSKISNNPAKISQ